MKNPKKTATLSPAQAACLCAIRRGKATKTDIAVEAKLSLNHAQAALEALCESGLIGRNPQRHGWGLTKLGQTCAVEKDDKHLTSRIRVGPAGQRLLDLLDRPMRGHEIAGHLEVSPQRVHQQVVRLMAIERVRVGDPDRVTLIVARREDRSVLLSYPEERVLSSLPQTEETTASYVAAALEVPLADVMERLTSLGDKGLVRQTGQSKRGAHYSLTEAGAAHLQYRSEAKKARPVPLVVKSDRVRQVLSHLAEHGPARIRDLRDALAIPHDSANALMQYLKRMGLIRKTADALTAPLELTPQGLETQQAMIRRSIPDDLGATAKATNAVSKAGNT
jgi:DNA-binding MarR family transcriptional regulator